MGWSALGRSERTHAMSKLAGRRNAPVPSAHVSAHSPSRGRLSASHDACGSIPEDGGTETFRGNPDAPDVNPVAHWVDVHPRGTSRPPLAPLLKRTLTPLTPKHSTVLHQFVRITSVRGRTTAAWGANRLAGRRAHHTPILRPRAACDAQRSEDRRRPSPVRLAFRMDHTALFGEGEGEDAEEQQTFGGEGRTSGEGEDANQSPRVGGKQEEEKFVEKENWWTTKPMDELEDVPEDLQEELSAVSVHAVPAPVALHARAPVGRVRRAHASPQNHPCRSLSRCPSAPPLPPSS